MTVIVTPGGDDSNSYATLAEANQYHTERLHNAAWTSANDTVKEAALLWATRTLDANFYWNGVRSTEEQALDWPRTGVTNRDGYYIDDEIVPVQVKNAQSELAFLLIVEDRTISSDPNADGVSELKLGSGSMIALKFRDKKMQSALAASVVVLVQDLGVFAGAGKTGGSSVVPTVRV